MQTRCVWLVVIHLDLNFVSLLVTINGAFVGKRIGKGMMVEVNLYMFVCIVNWEKNLM